MPLSQVQIKGKTVKEMQNQQTRKTQKRELYLSGL